MKLSSMLLAGALLCHACQAWAKPVGDVADWTQTFRSAASKTDPDAMLDAIAAAADPRLNLDSIKGVLQSIKTTVGSKTAEYTEEFNEKDVGTFIKRINIVVKYPQNFIFHSLVLVRGGEGWQIVQFNVDGNLNKILEAPWPT